MALVKNLLPEVRNRIFPEGFEPGQSRGFMVLKQPSEDAPPTDDEVGEDGTWLDKSEGNGRDPEV